MRIHAIVTLILLAGCSSTPEAFDFPDWGNVGYEGFADSIDVVAGSDAVNCGFFDLLTEEGRRDRAHGVRCAKHAYADGIPFKFGTVRLPLDSYAYEVLLRSPSGENWRIVYDIMIDSTAPQIWFQKCESVEFERRPHHYRVHDCTPYDGSEDPNWSGS